MLSMQTQQPIRQAIKLILIALVFAQPGFAQDQERQPDKTYCDERKLGQHFYCREPKKPEPEPERLKPQPRPSTPAPRPGQIAIQQLKALGEEIEEAKALAIVNPTEANISRYIELQRVVLDKASVFAESWQQTLRRNPKLDYSLQRPVGNIAKQIWKDARLDEQKTVMANLSERYGIWYFFRDSCPACKRQAQILQALMQRHPSLVVDAISVDGSFSDEFPESKMDNGVRRTLGLEDTPVPGLILVDTSTKKVNPIGFGLLTVDQIEERIFTMTTEGIGSDTLQKLSPETAQRIRSVMREGEANAAALQRVSATANR